MKSQPAKLAYAGGGGPGSASNLLMALFLKRAGLEMTNVSYRGTALAMTDLIAGHIPTMFVPISEALPQARGGTIRMLAVSSGTRAQQAPGRADHRRVGLSGIRLRVLDRHDGAGRNAEADRRSHRGRARARHQGSALRRATAARTASIRPIASPAEFSAFIAKEITRWGEAVKIAGVTLQ